MWLLTSVWILIFDFYFPKNISIFQDIFTCWLARVLRLLSGACKEPSGPWILTKGWNRDVEDRRMKRKKVLETWVLGMLPSIISSAMMLAFLLTPLINEICVSSANIKGLCQIINVWACDDWLQWIPIFLSDFHFFSHNHVFCFYIPPYQCFQYLTIQIVWKAAGVSWQGSRSTAIIQNCGRDSQSPAGHTCATILLTVTSGPHWTCSIF